MLTGCRRVVLSVALLLSAITPTRAQGTVDYVRDVKPIFRSRCYACHGALKQESGLRLDAGTSIRAGGDSGPAVVPGHAADSLLIERVTAADPADRMPPEGAPLAAEQIERLKEWIAAGAHSPGGETLDDDPREHWAFQPPQRAPLPDDVAPPWNAHPIDALIAEGHQRHGLVPVDVVDRRLLLRRLYLDLIGLPPLPDDYAAFLQDESPEAYFNAVDSLLESPHYGEQWGRHWMDVWRYSDWYGLGAQLRNSQKHLWHWRDWIVESLNADKGYDRMILEMLAADEIAPKDRGALRATGFLARNYYLFNRTTWLDDTIEHTSKALLGLTMNCAKCHDHKYDPLSQLDYYGIRAFFEPHQVRLDAVPGVTDLEADGLPRVFDAHPDLPTYLHIRGDPKNVDDSQPIAPAVPAFFDFAQVAVTPVDLPRDSYRPDLQPFVLEDHLRNAQRDLETARGALRSAHEQLAAAHMRAAIAERLTNDVPDRAAGVPPAGDLVFADDFTMATSQPWETGPGTWSYENGKVRQTATGAERRYLRSGVDHPVDFQAKLRFRIAGGDKWKSAGLSFDVHDGCGKLVYLSGVSPGSKLQLSYHDSEGRQVYPAEAKQERSVNFDETYELLVAARGRLVNVLLNGTHALAYELPVERNAGRFDLVAFDAVAEFESIEIRKLPADVELIDPSAGSADPAELLTVAQAEAAVSVAERRVALAELRPAAFRTAHDADDAKNQETPSEQMPERVRAAAAAARQVERAEAELAVAELQRALIDAQAASDEAKQQQTEKELAESRERLGRAVKAVDDPGERYVSLRASLKALEGPDETDESRLAPYPHRSTGRRTALARWITDRNHPLTARVAVNHIWLRHFGQPLVESVTDFGRRAPRPAQQKLLDWLAVEFMESGWSMKHLHRLIVTSRTYRLGTSRLGADGPTVAFDPANQYYWRREPQRMQSQVIRDSLLHLAGLLDPRLGGPTIDPRGGDTLYRRSLYFTHSRDDQHKFLSMFDDADILQCYRRTDSILPQQALTLVNSELSLSMADRITERLHELHPESDDEEFIAASFAVLLAREPTPEERATCGEILQRLRELPAIQQDSRPEVRARKNFVHALLNHNDFVTIR